MPGAPVWVEVALNGPWGPALQPGAPITVAAIVADGIAAARAGAAIVHVHAYDEASGRQKDDWQIHARIIERLRSAVDVIAYPTIRKGRPDEADLRLPVRALESDDLHRLVRPAGRSRKVPPQLRR